MEKGEYLLLRRARAQQALDRHVHAPLQEERLPGPEQAHAEAQQRRRLDEQRRHGRVMANMCIYSSFWGAQREDEDDERRRRRAVWVYMCQWG